LLVPAATADGDAIAIVNGRAISKDRLGKLLLDSHGLSAMQQLILLELAKSETERQKLSVTAADIQAEFERSLKQIAPDASATGVPLSAEERRSALERILSERCLSMPEFMIGMERNAHLRKLVERDFRIDEATLREEFARTRGEKVEVRHIQVAGPREAQEAINALDQGTPFEEVARQLSQNTTSAAEGGLLPPFSFTDDTIPPVLREAAFSLKPGEISAPIRAEKWYHVLQLERRIPPADVRFEDARGQVEQSLRDRAIPQEMARLATELFKKAEIRVLDQRLKTDYEQMLEKNAGTP